jgi:hypothetical protein
MDEERIKLRTVNLEVVEDYWARKRREDEQPFPTDDEVELPQLQPNVPARYPKSAEEHGKQ